MIEYLFPRTPVARAPAWLRWFREAMTMYRFWQFAAFSVFSLALFASRYWIVGQLRFRFLVWNLFLAWLPFGFGLCALWLWRHSWRKAACAMGVVWLLFFPNAPYILTDLMHLRRSAYLNWFDTLLLTTFALHGLFLGVIELRMLHDLLADECSKLWTWCALSSVMLLSGLAIYIGRFLRWNSWDAFFRPGTLLHDLYSHAIHQGKLTRMIQVTVICAMLLFFSYVLLGSPEGGKGTRER